MLVRDVPYVVGDRGSAGLECTFDISAAKIPGGAAYVAALEARVAELEGLVKNDKTGSTRSFVRLESVVRPPTAAEQSAGQQPRHRESACRLTLFSLLKDGPSLTQSACGEAAPMPSSSFANRLLELTFLYTQARYSIVDWIQVRKWYDLKLWTCVCH